MPSKPQIDEATGKPKWEAAYQDHLDGMTVTDIAKKYGVSRNAVLSWKKNRWNKFANTLVPSKMKLVKGTTDKITDGQNLLFAKYLPEEVNEIIGMMPRDSLDLLWANIQLQYAQVVRANRLCYVKDQNDFTERITMQADGKAGSTIAKTYQEAWDKHANFLTAMAKGLNTLERMIKTYEEILDRRSGDAAEMQRLRIERMKLEIALLNPESETAQNDSFIKALRESSKQVWDEDPET